MRSIEKIIKIFLIIAALNLTSCRLDDNLFNPNTNKISAYNFDNYTGKVDFKLDASYQVPANMITQFTLQSKASYESQPTKIYAVYIGNVQRITTDTVILYCHGNKE